MPIWQWENAMTKYYACLAGITLLALVSNAQAQFQEQRPADWRTFEVAEFGTRIQLRWGHLNEHSRPGAKPPQQTD